ncbi:unnamed protein product [Zymoseptoria tritici ST99CH_1A5]|uniref:Uncharacterized protein n=1 Tax=Zymoseptoria tritici ST99CH_1A5 TaxID=1276529 RepID=A0A1Y6LAA6_ZYMTR|nr:unnamed protein product [Zymoseptoria tritici ST99CH_3D1]SMY21437.1 unnamed protein product [Zymoseptoria tritici ST99CH_1A5]
MPPILTGPNAVAQPPETSSIDPPPSLAWSFRHDSQQWELVPTRPRELSSVTVTSSRTSIGSCGSHDTTRRGLGSASTAATSRDASDGRPSWANVGHLAMLRLDSGVVEEDEGRTMDTKSVAKEVEGETMPTRAESEGQEPRSPRRGLTPDAAAKRSEERHPYKSTAERGFTPTYRSLRSSPPPMPPVPDPAQWARGHVAESVSRQEAGGAEPQRARKSAFIEHLPENAGWFGEKKAGGRRASFWRYVRGKR